MAEPLILTLQLHPEDQGRFEALRRAHFPAERNLVEAHVTLFHHLPGESAGEVADLVALACARQGAFEVEVSGLRFLGRGVAFGLQSAVLAGLRAGLAQAWHEWLTAQDRQAFRPHVTIQNKVAPAEARALMAAMQAGFAPFVVRAEGLALWRYMGGPWALAGRHRFAG